MYFNDDAERRGVPSRPPRGVGIATIDSTALLIAIIAGNRKGLLPRCDDNDELRRLVWVLAK
jgi:hypothetical protein